MNSPIFPHQKTVYQALSETARVFFDCDWVDLPIRPRFARFITGATGTGKTHVVTALSKKLDLPLYQIVATNWIPLGSSQRGARPTWLDLVEFCHSNLRGIILIDEVDKLMGWAPWMQCIRTEAFSLMDGRVPENVALPTSESGYDDLDALKLLLEIAKNRLLDSFLIVGAGAFQSLWQAKASGRIGFTAKVEEDAWQLQKVDLAKVVPAEIVNRFASPILILQPLEEADYHSILANVLPELNAPLRHRVKKIAESSIAQAVANQTGCRWIEEVILQALIEESAPEHTSNLSVLETCPHMEFGTT